MCIRDRLSAERYAHRATLEQIRENEFNLNISRYVDTFKPEEDIDLATVQSEIARLEENLLAARSLVQQQLRALGL